MAFNGDLTHIHFPTPTGSRIRKPKRLTKVRAGTRGGAVLLEEPPRG